MAEFERATPEFAAACRWLVMAERMAPDLHNLRALVATDPPKGAGWAERQRMRLDAESQLRTWQPFLFPGDDDG